MQGRLNLLLLVSGATAVTLTFGLAPEGQVLSAAVASVVFNVLLELLRSRQVKQYSAPPALRSRPIARTPDLLHGPRTPQQGVEYALSSVCNDRRCVRRACAATKATAVALSAPCCAALCPLLDMANHSSSSGAEVEYDYFKDAFFSPAARPVRRGEEVTISYGQQTTDSLLQYYGFVEAADSDGDVYTLYGMAAALRERAAPARWEEAEALSGTGGLPSLEGVTLTDKAQVADEVKVALRYLLGAAGSLEDAAEKTSNRADAVVWEFVLEVARADQQANGLAGKGEGAALKAARKSGQAREVVARQYNVRKGQFLQARIKQLERRVAQMRQ